MSVFGVFYIHRYHYLVYGGNRSGIFSGRAMPLFECIAELMIVVLGVYFWCKYITIYFCYMTINLSSRGLLQVVLLDAKYFCIRLSREHLVQSKYILIQARDQYCWDAD